MPVADDIEYSLVLAPGVGTDHTQVTVEPAGMHLPSQRHETRIAYTASQLQVGRSSPHDVVWTIDGVEMQGCFKTVSIVSIVVALVAIVGIWCWCYKAKREQPRGDAALGATSATATAEARVAELEAGMAARDAILALSLIHI